MAETYEFFDPKSVYLGQPFTIILSQVHKNVKHLEMIWIPPGDFTMGTEENQPGFKEDEKAFSVTVTNGFWISRYPVTRYQWDRILFGAARDSDENQLNLPITSISWYDAMTFCWEIKRSWFWTFEHLGVPQYRFTLPLEAQWEYACRAGTQTVFYNGDDEVQLSEIAWYSQNSEGQLHSVGEKKPNPWGLYDMLGNVYEWCLDVYREYPNQPEIDWVGYKRNKRDLLHRVYRGGSASTPPSETHCAVRGYMQPIDGSSLNGFRLCLSNVEYDLDL